MLERIDDFIGRVRTLQPVTVLDNAGLGRGRPHVRAPSFAGMKRARDVIGVTPEVERVLSAAIKGGECEPQNYREDGNVNEQLNQTVTTSIAPCYHGSSTSRVTRPPMPFFSGTHSRCKLLSRRVSTNRPCGKFADDSARIWHGCSPSR